MLYLCWKNIKQKIMKKIAIVVLMMITVLSVHAQGLYTNVIQYDKFDDLISERSVKTLIEIDSNNNTITFETKGSEPVVYYYIGKPSYIGSKEEPENLVKNIYGYEVNYIAVPEDNFEACMAEAAASSDLNDDEFRRISKKYDIVEIKFRIVTTQYTHDYEGKVAWVKHYNGARTIYSEE